MGRTRTAYTGVNLALFDGRNAQAFRPSFRCFAIAAVVVVIPFVVVTDHADLPRWAVVI